MPNRQRNRLVVQYVSALAQERAGDLMAFRLDDPLLAAAYDYLDPDLPCVVASAQVREAIVEGCIARIRHHLFAEPLPFRQG